MTSVLLNETDTQLLMAATLEDDSAVAALRHWQSMANLDDARSAVRLVSQRLVDLAVRYKIPTIDLGRLKGITRYVWTSNTIKLRILYRAIDVLNEWNIPILLIKGGAMLARNPNINSQRAMGDYDILIHPEHFLSACEILAKAGFIPKEMEWDDIKGDGIDSITSGTPISIQGLTGDLDLHWRPLPGIYGDDLTRRLFEKAEPAKIEGRQVLIPNIAHHLFLAIDRCEPWDSNECLTRILEGHFLLSKFQSDLDIEEFELLIRHYSTQLKAIHYFDALQDFTNLKALPLSLLKAITMSSPELKRQSRNFALHSIPPGKRTEVNLRNIDIFDAQSNRRKWEIKTAGIIETFLKRMCRHHIFLPLIWRFINSRLGFSTKSPNFEDFWYPEKSGRWSRGHWSVITRSIDRSIPEIDVIDLKFSSILGNRPYVRLYFYGGKKIITAIIRDGSINSVKVKIAKSKNINNYAILLWCPDAASPLELGMSNDRRSLGAFIYKN